jgi:hypothetical protein
MHKLFFSITLSFLILISCTNKKPIIGNWKRAENGIVTNFINDSIGSIERSDTNTHRKIEPFKYHVQNDTLFEHTATHLYQPRKWVITKLDKDSLILYWEGTTARYYRAP